MRVCIGEKLFNPLLHTIIFRVSGQNIKVILEIKFYFLSTFQKNNSRRVCKSTYKKFWPYIQILFATMSQ